MLAFPHVVSNTPVGRLDARVKILALLAYSIAVFFVESWWGMAVFAVVVLGAALVARLPFRQVAAPMTPILFLAAFSILVNALSAGEAGLQTGLFLACRVVLLALASFVVCFSTTSTELLSAFRSLLSPLRALRVPVDDIAFTLSLAIRFIPVIADEYSSIRMAQRARGGEVAGVSFGRALAVYANTFAALFVGLFRHADSLVNAMSARCYGSVPIRSALTVRAVRAGDVCSLVGVSAICLAAALFL